MSAEHVFEIRRVARHAVLSVLVALALEGPMDAQTSTARAVTAIRAREVIRFQLSGKRLNVAVDGRSDFPELKKGQTFVTSDAVRLTFYRLNPLRHQIAVEVTAADDPSHGTMAKLIEGLLGVAAALRPGDAELQELVNKSLEARGGGRTRVPVDPTCDELEQAAKIVESLQTTLFDPAWSGATLRKQIKSWSEAIDVAHSSLATGMDAVRAGTKAIDEYLASGHKGKTLTKVIEDAESAVADLDDAIRRLLKSETPASSCEARARAVYQAIRLTDPHRRLAEIKKVHGSVTVLQAMLKTTYSDPAKWHGTVDGERKHDFVLREAVEPTSGKMQQVTIKVVALDYSKLDDFVPEVVAKHEDLVSGTFVVRQYSFLVPEIGVGMTVARADRVKFGTGTDDQGRTIVAATDPEEYTVDPSVLVNFVCRCGRAALVTPMLQIGAATSKDSPALLFGAGIRLFHAGRGDFAISGGWLLPWIKKLKSLAPGDVVNGTAEIEADLELRPVVGSNWYWSLQYKF